MGLTKHPHFSWWVSDARPAEVQSAYEIHAASSAERLRDDTADLWISGRIEGFENAHVPYQGLPVTSTQQVWWRVRSYDSDGEVSVAWQIGKQSFELQVTLPPGCTAEVDLPDGVIQRVQSGSHDFVMDYAKGRDGVPILREVTGN